MKRKPKPSNQRSKQKRAKNKKRNPSSHPVLNGIIIVFLILALVSFVHNLFTRPKTFTLMPAESISQGREGQGAFVFYEYAPVVYQGIDFSKSAINTDIRYREGSPLTALSPSVRNRIQRQLKNMETKEKDSAETRDKDYEEENKQEMEESSSEDLDQTPEENDDSKEEEEEENKEVLRPMTKAYYPSFGLQPYPYPHNYPRLGDNKRVANLTEDGREWEKRYLQKVLEQNRILTSPYGRVQIRLDGLENILTPASLMSMEPGDLENPPSIANSSKPGLKFVEDRLYFLAVDCPPTVRPRPFKLGQSIGLRLSDDLILNGQLDIIRKDQKGRELYVFSLREGYEKIKNMRFTRLEILQPKENVFLVPVDYMAKDKKGSYCYVLTESNQSIRVDVEIVGSDDKNIFVRAEETVPKNKPVLQAYDQLLKNPEKVKKEIEKD